MCTVETVKSEQCVGCGACAQVCPKSAITMHPDDDGFLHPAVNTAQCVRCGICVEVCPVISGIKADNNPIAYAAKCNNDAIRLTSSSGGIFTLLAEKVIEQGGVVFGAAMDRDLSVVHIAVNTKEELSKLRGSKYVQSRIGDTYKQAREFLNQGKTVYFSGTPCQIEGLLKFLRKPYENLITQDVVCHGVPSPLVWDRYVKRQEEKHHSAIKQVDFRCKQFGWREYRVRLYFQGGASFSQRKNKDPFMRCFLSDLCLRPSCYDCLFKKQDKASDFTLADFWGIQNYLPQMDDNRGISLVVCNTPKAQALFEQIKHSICFEEVCLQDVAQHNTAMYQSVPRPTARETFMEQIKNQPFERVVDKFCKVPSMPERNLRKLSRMIKSIIK